MSDRITYATESKAPLPMQVGHVKQTISAMNDAAGLCRRVEALRDLLCGSRPETVNKADDVRDGAFHALAQQAGQLVDAVGAANEALDFIEGFVR